jgi:DNA-binding transcriptional MerR regulator/methylmalonyl-CoA mutase cobalamin-binding subunit
MSPRRRAVTELSIAQVAALVGIPAPTIRSWERRYGFPTPGRTSGRHRRYSRAEVDKLRSLRDELGKGHRVRDAIALLEHPEEAHPDAPRLVRLCLRGAMRLDRGFLLSALDDAAAALGVEGAIQHVILPSLREIGSWWQSGSAAVVNEHILSDVARAWMSKHRTLAPAPFRRGTVLLACGPEDLHTGGLEAFATVLARRGWRFVMLGAQTPADEIPSAARLMDASSVVIASHMAVARRAAVRSIQIAIRDGFDVFYAGNAFAAKSNRRDLGGTYLGDDLIEASRSVERALERRAA